MFNNRKMKVIVVFAIAFTKCLLEGNDPSEYDFDNHRKQHLINTFQLKSKLDKLL